MKKTDAMRESLWQLERRISEAVSETANRIDFTAAETAPADLARMTARIHELTKNAVADVYTQLGLTPP